jgi:VWFA-related protein
MGQNMRRLLLLAALFSIVIPAFAARRVTVAELRQILAAERAANKSDADSAQQLDSLELTEQLTDPTLQRITADTNTGPKTAQALLLLADSSALLAPPAAEIPATPRPDLAAQAAMIGASVKYVSGSLHHLPDFLAARVTHSFNDAPNVIGQSGYVHGTQLHQVGTFTRQITYRNGREVLDSETSAPASKDKPASGPAGLATWGEFGPILAVVLSDAMKGRVTWSRWQQSPGSQLAVFKYAVPKSASHYLVDYCCSWGSGPVGYHDKPGYHGELYLDPATGVVHRLTLEAELTDFDVVSHASIDVRYGPVEIDGKSYICPTRGVAVSIDRNPAVKVIGGEFKIKRVNEITFTGFHKFGSTARIFAGSPESQAPLSPGAFPAASASQVSTSTDSPTPEPPAATTESVAPVAPVAPAAGLTAAAPPTSAAPPAPAEPPADSQQESVLSTMPVYKTNTREVVVDVVVTKANGDPVLGLSRQDFAVKEDGKPQSIDFFEEHTARTLPPAAQQPLPKLPPNIYTNVPPAPESDSVNVLLLDMLNTSMRDQAFVHNRMTDFLKNLQPGTRVAIFTLGSKLRFVQGFTSDSSLLLAALNNKKNGVSPQKDAASRDRTDASDDAAAIGRMTIISSGPGGSSYGIQAYASAQAEVANFAFGERIAMTFEALDSLARYLAGVPGRKNLLWFSSSFPVLIFPTVAQQEALRNQPQMRGFLTQIKETADVLTVAKVAVYPISAEGMMEEHILEADTAGPGAPEGSGHFGSGGGDGIMAPYIAGSSDRASKISSMEQLAAETGGKAYFNTNDLNGAAQRAMNDGANYYTLTYSPTNQKMDGQFRRIALHLNSGHYMLSYRRGYNADKPLALQAGSPAESKAGSDPIRSGEKDETDATTQADPLRPLLKFGLPNATGLLYGVRVVPASPQPSPDATHAGQNPDLKGAFTRYNVDFFVRWTDVAFQSAPNDAHTGKIEVGLMAFDRDGKAVNWEGGTQSMNIAPETFNAIQKSGVPAHMEIDLPDTDVFLVTGVYDLNTGKAGTLQVPITPAVAQDRSAAALQK